MFRLSNLHPIGDAELDVEHLRPLQDNGTPVHHGETLFFPTGDETELELPPFHRIKLDFPRNRYAVLKNTRGTFVLFKYLSKDASQDMTGEQALLITRTETKRTFRRIGTLTFNAMTGLPNTHARILGKHGEKLREVLESYTPRTITLV
jgi:hypothetical protein